MLTKTLDRFSGITLILGALIATSGSLLLLFVNATDPLDPLIGPAGWFGLIGWMILLLGLPWLHARQVQSARIASLVAFTLFFFAGLLVGIGQHIIFALIAPWLAANAATRPVLLAGTPLLDLFFIVGELFLLAGVILSGIVTIRTRIFPRWAGALLIVGAIVRICGQALSLPEFVGSIGLVLLYTALIWLGGALWSQQTSQFTVSLSSPVQTRTGQNS